MLKLNKNLALIVSLLFTVNLTFVEPLLWFSAQGVILANIFIALTFYFWLNKSKLAYLFIVFAGFSYSTGVGVGIIFGVISLLYGRFIPVYFILGILSYFAGPLIAGETLGQITPVIRNPLTDFLLYSAFVIGGVGRGVYGRLFLPGFEPRHFEIFKTLLSFMPFAFISSLVVFLRRKLLLSLSVLIVYPYIWAGAIRYQFGIKQALAERYAYTPLFFAVILIGLLLKYFFDKKILKSTKPVVIIVTIILIFQTIAFYKKAVEFEKRPMQTKKYIEELQSSYRKDEIIIDTPLPDFINQLLTVSDLYALIGGKKKIRFITP